MNPQPTNPLQPTSPVQSGPDLTARLQSWAEEAVKLPLPGHGDTWARFVRLGQVAEEDLVLARLAEGHADAVAILDEAGASGGCGVYGVWAARSSTGDLRATPGPGGWELHGVKGFCSGAGIIDRALVTADGPDGPRLFDVDLRAGGITVVPDSWPAVGMSGSASAAVSFDTVRIGSDQAVGDPGFYTSRIGFWWGAAGVAACWWGGAVGLLTGVRDHLGGREPGDHASAAFGSASARAFSMRETLRGTAEIIDSRPTDVAAARQAARGVREVVHDGAVAVLAGAAAAGGARPICLDRAQSQRSADLYAYLAQHHVGPDAAALGRELLTGPDVVALGRTLPVDPVDAVR
jgi:alkylation response protein AidB-like acyl-CoA dehydrogenase